MWCLSVNLFLFMAVSASALTPAVAVEPDTLQSEPLREVTVTGQGRPANDRSFVQTLTVHQLQETNSLSVSEAVKFFAGATVKDYGGMGGMKTLSVRGMGAHHTAVAYDGITLTDCQTGQIDLGKYSLDNVELISLSIGDGNTIFQPARLNAASGLLAIRTKQPVFDGNQCFHGMVGMKGGSFGLLSPDMLLEFRLNPLLDLSVSAEGIRTTGNYSYRLYYGDASDAYTMEQRNNNELTSYRFESTLFGHFRNKGQLEVKGYYYESSRGLPGAVILYNPYASQHLWDRNGFLQGRYVQSFSPRLRWMANAKYNNSWQRYLNPDYLGSSGEEDYRYGQEEYYLSSAFLYNADNGFSLALATDGAVNQMTSNLYQFSNPLRMTLLGNLSASYDGDIITASANLLGTAINEESLLNEPASDVWKLSPSFNLSVRPFSQDGFKIRFFYKESFRMPSFNDLYYSAVGNRSLKPENSRQFDLGLTGRIPELPTGTRIQISLDGYHNNISDKIMAIPTKNIFVWSMVNLGKVSITGADLSIDISQPVTEGYHLMGVWNHSYQRALDVTDPLAAEYRNQIAYAPRVFGSGRAGLETPYGKLSWAVIYSGHRYVTGHNLAENDLPGYADQSLSLEKAVDIMKMKLTFRTEVLNLTNENYEIIRNFPMPGCSWRVGLKVGFL